MFGLSRERSRPPVACRQRSPTLSTSEATMTSIRHAPARAVLVLALCGSYSSLAAQASRSALDPITSAVINHPITTSSAEARANSLDEFKTNLALAEQNASGASEAERLQIQMARKGFDNDLAGQLALGQQLVAKYPDSPRAWLGLAGVQGALNKN